MSLFPGDVVIVKDIEFNSGAVDPSVLGRPCLVLYGNNDSLTVLPFTSKVYKYQNFNDYCFYDFGDRLSMVELAVPLTIKRDQVIHPIRNISKDYFRIIYRFQKLFNESKNTELQKCSNKLLAYMNMEYILKPILVERQAQLRKRSKELINEKKEINDEDLVQKKLTKHKVSLYKKNKQFQTAYME